MQPVVFDTVPPAANPRPTPDNKPRSMLGTIRGLFRAAVAAVTRRSPNPPPKPRRQRSGETDKGAVAPWQTVLRRFTKTSAVAARGRYAALQPAQEPETADPYAAATASTATTFQWLMNLWDANSSMEDSGGLDDSFDTTQNNYYPQP